MSGHGEGRGEALVLVASHPSAENTGRGQGRPFSRESRGRRTKINNYGWTLRIIGLLLQTKIVFFKINSRHQGCGHIIIYNK